MKKPPHVRKASAYPIFLNLAGARVLVVGGGHVAEQKVKGLLESGAKLWVVAKEISTRLELLSKKNGARVNRRAFRVGDLLGKQVVFAATSSRQVNQSIAREAKRMGLLVCVVDAPDEGNFSLPSVAKVGLLKLAISTSGSSPALAKLLRQHLEKTIKTSSLPWLLKELAALRPDFKRNPLFHKKVMGFLQTPGFLKDVLNHDSKTAKNLRLQWKRVCQTKHVF